MQVLGAALATGGVALACAVILNGLWNCIDWCAWKLHLAACAGRKAQDRQSHVMSERWVRTLEAE